jgi:hypothetical protein
VRAHRASRKSAMPPIGEEKECLLKVNPKRRHI